MYATGYKTRKIFNSNATTSNQAMKWNAHYNGSKADIDIDLIDNGNTKHFSGTLNGNQLAALYNDVLLQPVTPIPLDKRLLNDFNVPLLPAPSTHRRRRHHKRQRKTYKRYSPPPKAKSPIIYTPPTPNTPSYH